MKRTNKKLSLRSETLRSLTPEQMGEAAGGDLYPILVVKSRLIICVAPGPITTTSASLVDGCPSQMGCNFTIVINPYIIKF